MTYKKITIDGAKCDFCGKEISYKELNTSDWDWYTEFAEETHHACRFCKKKPEWLEWVEAARNK